MAANRPSSFVVIDGATTYNFPIAPNQNGQGQNIRWTTNPWELGDVPAIALKDFGFKIPLFPFTGGLGTNKTRNKDSYSTAYAETSYDDLITTGPREKDYTIANGVAPVKGVEFDSKEFFIDGRYLYYIPLTGDVRLAASALDTDFGVGNGATDACVFQNELVVAMGPNTNIWRRFTTADTLSGTANAAVSTTNTSLTDTRITTLAGSKYIGATITCNGKTMVVTSVSGGNTFNGTGGWSGGANPGNGFLWSMSSWAQHTDAVRASAVGVVDDTMWKGSVNILSGALSYPHLSASYAASYPVGDSTYSIVNIIDYVGGVWAGKADGMYLGDPSGKYHNQAPQLKKWPHPNNCKGAFVAHGSLWVPSATGLLRLNGGSSFISGPEVMNIPNYLFWIGGGVEWDGDIYLVVWDQSSTSWSSLIKMKRDINNKNKYTFHQLSTVSAPGTQLTSISISTVPTVPYIFVTQAIAAPNNYVAGFCLSRGGGRLIDDPLHLYATAGGSISTGQLSPSGEDYTLTSYIEGIEVFLKLYDANNSFQASYIADSGASLSFYEDVDTPATALISGPLLYSKKIMYPARGTKCNVIDITLNWNDWTTTSGKNRVEIKDAYLFGYHRPKQTDRLIVTLIADGATLNGNDTASGVSLMDMHTLFSGWADNSTLLYIELQDYQDNKRPSTTFLVTHVERTNVEVENKDRVDALMVTLVRVPHAPGYGVI